MAIAHILKQLSRECIVARGSLDRAKHIFKYPWSSGRWIVNWTNENIFALAWGIMGTA